MFSGFDTPERYREYLGTNNPRELADLLYFEKFGKAINWSHPRDLNEKINWLAYKSDTTLWTVLSDKFLVREYIASKGLAHILPALYGFWKSAEEIEFDILPERFVLKCNHDSGSVFPVKDKTLFNVPEIRQIIEDRLSVPFGIKTAEPHYLGIKRLVFAEEYLENTPDLSDSLIDYKFWSFQGVSEYCLVCYDTADWENKKSGIFDVREWKLRKDKVMNHSKLPTKEIPKPDRLDEMLEIVYCLSNTFPQCRVDLYESHGRVYFGELTFTSGCGRMKNYTDEFLLELGGKVILPTGINYSDK